MIIKTHITLKEYTKLLYGLIYRKPVMILILIVDFLLLIWILGFYLNFLPVPEPKIYQYITLGLITVIQPLTILNTVWRNYRSSNHLIEELEIEITKDEIKMHGQSFFKEIKWIKIFKIVEHNNWFLIYENTFSAIVIPKKAFDSDSLKEFVSIMKSIKDIPVQLKSNT